ncbi:unnamed protein product [Sphenostylis stenocarpa]|uniref:Uncharacterized protein n=1 Tax=Sphenostylis stenocarpa TaxID=92480 RepID=A0AA86V673_9FABA|nr:unnamed protein product [Sphenostylis stenocarpa]
MPLITVQGLEVEGGEEKKGKEGMVDGKFGNEAGIGGRLREGSVGIMLGSKGGSVVGLGRVIEVPGKFGVVVVCKSWRDAKLKLMLEKVTTTTRKKGVMKDLLEAMVDELKRRVEGSDYECVEVKGEEVHGEVVVEGGGERKGREGKVVGIMVGNEGKLVGGSGGRVSCGKVGMLMLGIEGCGRDGIVGKFGNVVCRRWREANAISMLEKEMAMKKTTIMQL